MARMEGFRALCFPGKLLRLIAVQLFRRRLKQSWEKDLNRDKGNVGGVMSRNNSCFQVQPRSRILDLQELSPDGTDLDKTVAWASQYPYAHPLWLGPFKIYLNINHVKNILLTSAPKDYFIYPFLIPWIEEVRNKRKKTLKDGKELEKITVMRNLDFLDILIYAKDEDGKGLSDEEIRAEVDTFMFEGHDMTASGIFWLLYCLAQNPEHQQKCREEIKQHKQIEWDLLNKMPYNTMCIKESMRLYPPVQGISRRLNKPFTFFDGRKILCAECNMVKGMEWDHAMRHRINGSSDTILRHGLPTTGSLMNWRGTNNAASVKSAKSTAYILIKILKLFRKRWMLMAAMKPFPGPPSHWLYGHALEFSQDGTDLDKALRWAKNYPYGHQVWIGPFTAFLAVYHPDYAKALLAISEPKDDVIYRFMLPWIGDGLLISSGQKWYRHRRLLTPGFHYDILKSYVQEIAESTRIMLDKWALLSTNEKSVELYHHLSLMTLDSILKCAFSYHSNCQIESHNSYIQAVYELGFLASHRFKTFHHHYDLIYYFTPHGYRFRKACKLAHEHTDKVINQRKEALKNEKELERIQEKKHCDFLDILLCSKDENGVGLSDEDLRAEVDTFMFEGHDTTASGISWLMYCLAQHPEHQQKCREEVQKLLDGHDEFKWEFLSTMPYTTMCLKESLRLFPPLPGLSRKLTKPLVFPDGKQVPAGCLVALSIYSLHRNPMFWEKPEEFDPLRFTTENSEHRHHHAFIPFSVGPRNCIGQHFAMNEMKVAIALILNRFELEVDESKPPIKVPQLVLRSKNGIYLKIKKLQAEGKSGKFSKLSQ